MSGPVGSDKHPWYVFVWQRTEIVKVRAEDFDAALALAEQHERDGSSLASPSWRLTLTAGPIAGTVGDDEGPDFVDETE